MLPREITRKMAVRLEDVIFTESRARGHLRNLFKKLQRNGTGPGHGTSRSANFIIKNGVRTLQLMASSVTNTRYRQWNENTTDPNIKADFLDYSNGMNATGVIGRNMEYHLPFVGYVALGLLALGVFFGVFFYFMFRLSPGTQSGNSSESSAEWYFDVDREANNNRRDERQPLTLIDLEQEDEKCPFCQSAKKLFGSSIRTYLYAWQKIKETSYNLGNQVIQTSQYYSAPANSD